MASDCKKDTIIYSRKKQKNSKNDNCIITLNIVYINGNPNTNPSVNSNFCQTFVLKQNQFEIPIHV